MIEYILYSLTIFMRYFTAIFMFSLFIYLTAVRNPRGERIPAKFRGALLLISFVVFDYARDGSIIPVYDEYIVAIVLYGTVNAMFWWGFHETRKNYEVPPPNQGIPILLMQVREDINELKDEFRR